MRDPRFVDLRRTTVATAVSPIESRATSAPQRFRLRVFRAQRHGRVHSLHPLDVVLAAEALLTIRVHPRSLTSSY